MTEVEYFKLLNKKYKSIERHGERFTEFMSKRESNEGAVTTRSSTYDRKKVTGASY